MYRHLLATTDGSPFALEAACHAVGLAKSLSARITAITVTPTWRALALSEIAVGRDEGQFSAQAQAFAARCLAPIQAEAARLGVACEVIALEGDRPYEVIAATAAERGCDLVVVGSHGRRGVERLMLGSETTKLLIHSPVPVLVYRRKPSTVAA